MKSYIRVIRLIDKIALLIALIGGFGYIIYNIVHPEAYIYEFRGEYVKEYF